MPTDVDTPNHAELACSEALTRGGGRDCVLTFWDAAEGREKGKVSLTKGRQHPQLWGVFALTYSPDGKAVATGLGNWNRGQREGEIRLIDPEKKQTIQMIVKENPRLIVCVEFSPDGTRLAACSTEGVKVWRVSRN